VAIFVQIREVIAHPRFLLADIRIVPENRVLYLPVGRGKEGLEACTCVMFIGIMVIWTLGRRFSSSKIALTGWMRPQ